MVAIEVSRRQLSTELPLNKLCMMEFIRHFVARTVLLEAVRDHGLLLVAIRGSHRLTPVHGLVVSIWGYLSVIYLLVFVLFCFELSVDLMGLDEDDLLDLLGLGGVRGSKWPAGLF